MEGFQQNCNLPKFQDPSLLLSANWIRPEDVTFYRSLGIRRFKVAGREMPASWLDRAVHAYVAGSYRGNLVDLLTMPPLAWEFKPLMSSFSTIVVCRVSSKGSAH